MLFLGLAKSESDLQSQTPILCPASVHSCYPVCPGGYGLLLHVLGVQLFYCETLTNMAANS